MDHVTNKEVTYSIRHVLGPYEDRITSVRKGKLRWYGHVKISTGLAKMILQGTVTGRQKKRWEDNIPEMTVLGFCEALERLRTERNGEKVDVRSSLITQRSFRPRDE